MITIKNTFSSFCHLQIMALLTITVLAAGCGKHEAATSTIGTAYGAVIGASVSRNNPATGALIGGLVGNVIGSSIGRGADEEEQQEESERREIAHTQEKMAIHKELERTKQENRRLKEKWCVDCGRNVVLSGAKSCPDCGGSLIYERYCRECTAVFTPQSGYRYCPYCFPKTKLSAR